jgi:hypothetical protein
LVTVDAERISFFAVVLSDCPEVPPHWNADGDRTISSVGIVAVLHPETIAFVAMLPTYWPQLLGAINPGHGP